MDEVDEVGEVGAKGRTANGATAPAAEPAGATVQLRVAEVLPEAAAGPQAEADVPGAHASGLLPEGGAVEAPQAVAVQAAALLNRAVHVADIGRQAVVRGSRRAAEGAARGAWAHHALTSIAPPRIPADVPWVLSVGALLGRHPRTPQLAHKALGLLDGFGAVHLGPESVGFDGEEIPWAKVVAIRTRNAFEVMTTQALEQEVDRIRQFLPPVPGRKWLVTRAAEALATVVLAALEHGSVDRPLDQVEVPVEIVHKGLLGRERVQTGGLFSVAGLVVVPQAAESLAATARQHGLPVVPGRPLSAVQPDRADRVGILRDRTDAMAALLARLQREESDDLDHVDHVDHVPAPRPADARSVPDPRADWAR
ncbi:hypothetical protein ABH931_001257 [Streptacidiphilus sp. MAP12-33]|uniref:hypothetical protein n=1 Tax=Streptacidiphilus sp. MAP12-33 TaxID=3156266 RepID=UPI003519B920